MHKYHLRFFLLILVLALVASSVNAQEVEDTIKIKTRVVFLDALVKDKKTNLPISNLTPENFAVLDDGKPREISYFTREGQARKPLALIVILDLREDGAGRFLKRAEILKAMEDELAKLPPGDEVAVIATNIGEDEGRTWLTEFTNDRAKIAAALARVPAMCVSEPATQEAVATQNNTAAGNVKVDEIIVKVETVQGRNGAVVTRKTRRDGRVEVTRVSKDGKMTVELGDIYDMAAAVQDAAQKAQELRPNSQVSLEWVSDGIAPIFYEERDATEQVLIRDKVVFNSLAVELRTLFNVLLPVGNPIA